MKRLLPALMLLILQLPARGQGYDPAKVGKKAAAAYRKALDIASEGRFREAIGQIDLAIAADARFVDAYLSKAGLYGELKDYARAVEQYEKAFSLDQVYTAEYRLPYAINLAGMGAFSKAKVALDMFLASSSLDERSRKAAAYRLDCMTFARSLDSLRSGRDYVFSPRNMGDSIKVPIIVRLQGTNAELAKEMIDNSGMPILSAVQFQEAADQVKKALN